MKKYIDRIRNMEITPRQLQFGCLLVLGLIDLLLVTVAPLHPWLFEYLVESYVVVPALLFVGVTLTTKRSKAARCDLLLGIVVVLWMALAQAAQRKALTEPANISMWWAVYLLAFPFASATRDGEKSQGLKLMGAIAVAVSVWLSVCSVFEVFNALPPFLSKIYGWSGNARLQATTNPNMSSWLFMIGIAFSIGFASRAERNWQRGLLVGAVVLQLGVLALTNTRTIILMTAALVAGVVFFCIFKGGWKRFALGVLAAVVAAGAVYTVSQVLFEKNAEYLFSKQIITAESTKAESAVPQPEQEDLTDAQKAIASRKDFVGHLTDLHGRTEIWTSGLNAMRMHPEYCLRGTWLVGGAVKEGGNSWEVMHSHNSWMEILIGFGIPGLLLAIYFTFLGLRGSLCMLFSIGSSMWQKCVAMLVLCMMGAGMLEPFLFTAYTYCHFDSVMFLLCIGYLNLWRTEIKHPERV